MPIVFHGWSKIPVTGMIAIMMAIILAGTSGTANAETYHVSPHGSDENPGTSEKTAWKTPERVNRQVLRPGDRVLFQRGGRFTGQLAPQGSGALVDGKPVPVVIGSYGKGSPPRIDGEGKVLDTILVRNCEFLEIRDLEVTNQGPEREVNRTGIRLLADSAGAVRHLRLCNLFVHDVNSDLRKSHEGHGILFESRGNGHFDGLAIEDCRLLRTDRNGICGLAQGGARSRKVVIRGNLLEDIGGDGIKPWGCDAPLVEHNRLKDGRTRCEDYAAGIWPWDCDDAVIQFNEVSGMRGDKDGQSFDSDARCRRSVFQYNYSHDNEGGFMLVCAYRDAYCEGTVIRYNISLNDGIKSARVFHLGGPVRDTHIYNNTIHIGPHQDLPLCLFTEYEGWTDGTRFANNLVIVEGRVRFVFGKSTGNVFENNVVYGKLEGAPAGIEVREGPPPLARPGSSGEGFKSLDGYRLKKGSDLPGIVIPDCGPRDFFGNPIPASRQRSIGADQGKR